ncbi:MAG: Holliday junction branch migration protein RuvA [Spirochaetaceae bacterium]|nr:MAG: Holliday junction branch migration protein RuvA [Spirochaetaceae bacterium]
MFNSLTGKLTYKGQTSVFILTGGVEWDIAVTRNTCDTLPSIGADARVFIYLVHRDDQMKFYGFSTTEERELFCELLRVDGVGPRLAQKILSSITPHELAQAIDSENIARLESIHGLGKKTASKLLLNLKGRVLPSQGAHTGNVAADDIAEALTGMGFDRKIARDAVAKVQKEVAGLDLAPDEMEKELFRRALKIAGGEKKGR